MTNITLKAFSLIELSITVLIIGVITIVALNGKSLVVKANCVVSTLGSKSITDNLNNPTALTKNKSTAYENCVNGIVATIDSLTACSGSTCNSCKTLLADNPGIASGTYTIDPDGAGALSPFNAYCDMTTDGGGWTLVLNYLHKGGTNPAIVVKTTNLPIFNSSNLGNDESTNSTSWGHASRNLLNKFSFTEVRFYGRTSNPNNGGANNRTANFKTSLANCLNYFRTGVADCSGLNSSFTQLSGHSSYLPAQITNYNAFGTSTDYELTSMPFYKTGSYHWAINTGGRWSMDDQPDAQGSGYQFDTYHQVWIR